jgi:hypothetical protein
MSVGSTRVTSEQPSGASTRFAGFYTFVLMAVYNLAVAGIIAVPVQFLLKTKFHLPPTQISVFSFMTDSPYFVGFAFGFLRDKWRPMGKGDRGYFLVVPILLALAYGFLAFSNGSYSVLLGGMIAISALCALLGAAAQPHSSLFQSSSRQNP